jgi:hypothetical protein
VARGVVEEEAGESGEDRDRVTVDVHGSGLMEVSHGVGGVHCGDLSSDVG